MRGKSAAWYTGIMRILSLDTNSSDSVHECLIEATAVLRGGGTVVYPTDTVYGLGANALDTRAVEWVFRIKDRSAQKPLPVAVRDVEMAREISILSSIGEAFLRRVWPGAVTAVVHKRANLPDLVTGGSSTVGVRQPKSDFLARLFEKIIFPITSTSANPSGEEAACAIGEVCNHFKSLRYLPDLIIDAGDLAPSQPSTIIDITGQEPRILRAGPVSSEELFQIFSSLHMHAHE